MKPQPRIPPATSLPPITINKPRLLRDLNAVSRIGIGDRGSVTRLVFSIKELRSRQFLIHQMRQIGLQIHIDRIGNIFGRLDGANAKPAAILVGSHLDTVVHGGKFDGTLGVIAALEAVRTLKEKKIVLPSPVEVVCFVGEESSRFGYSTLGSSLLTGEVRGKDLVHAADAQGTKLEDILASMGIYRNNLRSMRRDPSTIKAYLELHIEQGPILEAKKKPIGIVTSIAAPTRFRVVFTGQADHSGTTPMEMRRDALVAASELIVAVEKVCRRYAHVEQGRVVGTVGAMKIEPGVINAIPGRAELSVDIRSISAEAKKQVVRLVQAQIDEIARRRNIEAEILPLREEDPVPLDKRLVRLLKECCEAKNIAYEIMPSGAGHDAMQMAKITAAGMLFIPSRRGISHSPLEWSEPEDICLGGQLLLDSIIRVANEAI
ncbi:MAG TPA: M20 family metallo-hydrolase [Candidatus Binatia bacterium]|nr:M20 family metallo-hydrolase [Candidatus Binatia bacterium]